MKDLELSLGQDRELGYDGERRRWSYCSTGYGVGGCRTPWGAVLAVWRWRLGDRLRGRR